MKGLVTVDCKYKCGHTYWRYYYSGIDEETVRRDIIKAQKDKCSACKRSGREDVY